MRLGDVLDAEEADRRFHEHQELDLARRQAAFGFQFVHHFGDGPDMFGAVHLGQHQGGHAGDHRGLDIAHQHAPGAIDPHDDVGAVAVHLRDRFRDQSAGMVLLGRSDRVLQVQDDGIGTLVGPGADEFLGRYGNKHQRAPNGQVIAHDQASLIMPSAARPAMRAAS